ncbi:MAG: ankyrin repeat domain-containing protein [Gemmatimonadetes bacterium]|nr:ankyrin repeat domain-containing protein [Gemmatimonadota bacterium]
MRADGFGWEARRGGVAVLACGVALVLSLGAARSNPGDAPLADAVMRGDSARVRTLIRQGMDVNAAQADGMTALHWAAQRGDLGSAQVLVAAGARVDALTRNGNYTPLHLAAREGRASVVKVLLAGGADARATTSTGGATALHFAAGRGDAESVTLLVDKGVPVDVREAAFGQTPLMWAAAYDRVAAIDVLLKKGAGLEAASRIEDIPKSERELRAELAQRSRRVAALKAAESPLAPTTVNPTIAPSAAPVAPTGRGGAPAASAPTASAPAAGAAAPQTATLTVPPAGGAPGAASAAAPGAPGAPAAAQGGRGAGAGAAAAAQAGGRGPSYGDLIGNKGGLTPLLFAIREGNTASVERLLAAGAQINHVSEGDHTSPLLMAVINGRFDMAKMLMAKGADVKLQSDAGATPLYAVINTQWAPKSLYPQPTAQLQQQVSHLELMEAMLKAGADPNVRLKKHLWFMSYNFDLLGVNTVGATAFWRAAYGLDVPAMRLLLKYGADPNVPTIKPTGRLPGDDAPEDGAGGADPSGLPPIPDGGPGVYPIHAASGVGYGEGFAANSHRHAPDAWLPTVKFLVEELKQDVNARDHNGYNTLHHAAARGDNELIQYLVSKGADVKAISRRGQTTADMANGPVQRIPPFLETVELLVKLGATNSNKCKSC